MSRGLFITSKGMSIVPFCTKCQQEHRRPVNGGCKRKNGKRR